MSESARSSLPSITCRHHHRPRPHPLPHNNNKNHTSNVSIIQTMPTKTRLDWTRLARLHATDHILVSLKLPVHPCIRYRRPCPSSTSAHAISCPKLRYSSASTSRTPRSLGPPDWRPSTSSSLPLDLTMPHLPTHLTAFHPENLPSTATQSQSQSQSPAST